MTGVRPPSDETMRAKHVNDQTRWWERAACAGVPFALFDTAKERGVPTGPEQKRRAAARVICEGCPVITECRTDADLLPDPSFRAGYTAVERNRQTRAKRSTS